MIKVYILITHVNDVCNEEDVVEKSHKRYTVNTKIVHGKV